MKKINVVIVDDEIHNIDLLEYFLTQYCPQTNIIGTASSKKKAISLINLLNPDLILLDVVLGEYTGFEIIEEIKHINVKTIFISDYDKYALKAFQFNAIDYLLKPIEVDKLVKAINKAYNDIKTNKYTSYKQLKQLSENIKEKQSLDLIAVSSISDIEFIKLEDIIYLKSEGRYTEFFLKDQVKIIACKNLGEYDNLIDNIYFFRIHKSYIVNLKHVTKISKVSGSCEMINKDSLPIAKRRQDLLLRILKLK